MAKSPKQSCHAGAPGAEDFVSKLQKDPWTLLSSRTPEYIPQPQVPEVDLKTQDGHRWGQFPSAQSSLTAKILS